MRRTDDVLDTVRTVIAEVLEVDAMSITSHARFVEDLEADSLDIIDLVAAIEDAFGCTVPDSVVNGILTVGDLVVYLSDQRSLDA